MLSYSAIRLVRAIGSAFQLLIGRMFIGMRNARHVPPELAGSKIVYAEKSFSITRPIHLVARIDRVYNDGHAFALLELKTRQNNRVYESDIIELSAQRLAVQYGTGLRIHDQGYVELLNPESRRRTIHKVALHPEHRITEIAHRRRLLLAGDIAPRGPATIGCCGHCEFQVECRWLGGDPCAD